jgi:predicted AlkP superfamily pyrophosphatase or phosphodiesterase
MKKRDLKTFSYAVFAALGVSLFAGATRAEQVADPNPRLVVIIAIDQLRRDRLDPTLPGGLGRLAREGRVYRQGTLDHAGTATCPGHVSIVSGRHPGPIGVPGNHYLDPKGERIYCVEDDPETTSVIGVDPASGRSPRKIRSDSLGDWMKELGTRIPATWETQHPLEGERVDDFEGESDNNGRAFPHPTRSDDLEEAAQLLLMSPYPDQFTLEFAEELVVQENLGQNEAPDLLAIGLSSIDRVGHAYGPWSWESHDALMRLDTELGEFLDFLDERIGPGRTLIALSADHGVLPLPEWLIAHGQATCPDPDGRRSALWLVAGVYFDLWREFSPLFSKPGAWMHAGAAGLRVNQELASRHGVDPQRVIAETKRLLEAEDVIEKAWTRDEILNGTDEFARLYRNSYDPERSGDLTIQVAEGCLVWPFDEGTSHGSPYAYDRDVPIVLWGTGVIGGTIDGRARTIDIGPSLADRLGVPFPDNLDGQPLP